MSIKCLKMHFHFQLFKKWFLQFVNCGILKVCGSSKSVKPVLRGNLRELESKALTLRAFFLEVSVFFSTNRNKNIFNHISASFCFHLSTLARFHSKTILFDTFSFIVHFKRPKTLIIQNSALLHRKTAITNYVGSKIPTSYFEKLGLT